MPSRIVISIFTIWSWLIRVGQRMNAVRAACVSLCLFWCMFIRSIKQECSSNYVSNFRRNFFLSTVMDPSDGKSSIISYFEPKSRFLFGVETWCLKLALIALFRWACNSILKFPQAKSFNKLSYILLRWKFKRVDRLLLPAFFLI